MLLAVVAPSNEGQLLHANLSPNPVAKATGDTQKTTIYENNAKHEIIYGDSVNGIFTQVAPAPLPNSTYICCNDGVGGLTRCLNKKQQTQLRSITISKAIAPKHKYENYIANPRAKLNSKGVQKTNNE